MANPDHYKYMPRLPEEERLERAECEEREELGNDVEQETVFEVVEEVPAAEESPVRAREEVSSDPEPKDFSTEVLFGRGLLKFFYDFFNPLLVPAYLTILIFELSILSLVAPAATLSFTLTVFCATCVFPLLTVFVLRRVGSVSGFSLPDRSDRLFPYIIELLALTGITLFFAYKGAPTWVWMVYCGAAVSVLFNFLLNFRWRVSNHCTALAAALATLIVINGDSMPHPSLGWWAIGVMALCGINGTGAIILGNHSLKDVLIGYVTGFLPIIILALVIA